MVQYVSDIIKATHLNTTKETIRFHISGVLIFYGLDPQFLTDGEIGHFCRSN